MVDSKRKLAEQAISSARLALENGNTLEAKNLAEQAGQLAPEMEDPWLVLAFLAEPAEGLKYLEKALALNPDSKRAQKGIHYLITKMQAQNQTIPFGYEKFIESELMPSHRWEKVSDENLMQKSESRDEVVKPMEYKAVEPVVIPEDKKVESMAYNHSIEKTKIKTISVSEPISPSKHNAQITFSQKQPYNNQGVDWVGILISLFSLSILSITILAILYTNHLLPFLK